MSKIDFVFVALGIFCYLTTMLRLRDQDSRVAQYEELQKKKKLYADFMLEQKRKETLAKAAEERKSKRKLDFKQMASTMERLSEMSDQEVMRQSRITSGKY